ncbi:FliM/FliN family flagellar motor switch protein [Rhodobacter sp. NTK016B]|uniref:FliM/FliN family flagellar motor switch protein n=1 Tax=Rhodobacter sp. NTK016B TaxID=2759676 RepID=UPI001A8E16C3|nr:FliM/FliN family flagellar motor C-terminal domain-containing protein [Rhodobacter sp. NTK016B]MBN8291630.1 FliM/FliN family flagellar motor switch protein [Rhodobacter sp. NTK016B]
MSVPDRDPVLRRKLTPRPPPPDPDAPVLSGRAGLLARAFGRSISNAAPLVAEDTALHWKHASLPELLDAIDSDAFVMLLDTGGGPPGLVTMDQQGFATVIEAMTIGRLGVAKPGIRRPTSTDSALLAEILDAALKGLGPEDPVTGFRCARPVPDHRLLPVLLDEIDYDLVALTAVLISGDVTRPLRLMLALPPLPEDPVDPSDTDTPAPSWTEAIEDAVMGASADLRAELGRLRLPLADVLALASGRALTLPLSNLEEVNLVALDGVTHAIGRLGQTRGMRAVRLTGWPGSLQHHTMIDAAPPRAQGAAAGLGTGMSLGAPLDDPPQGDTSEDAQPFTFQGAEPTEPDDPAAGFPAMAPMSLDLPGDD